MEKKYRLEPFDIERAKAGEPVSTKSGKDVKILCFDRKHSNYPIVTLVSSDETLMTYTLQGKNCMAIEGCNDDLMIKTEIKESYVYAEVAGEIIPFEDIKAKGVIDLKSLNWLIIKTYDGKFLKIWKKDLPKRTWEEAQVVTSKIGMGWRCPTRHECIDIYSARFKGLDNAMKEIEGTLLTKIYWTSEADSDPQFSKGSAVFFNSCIGYLSINDKYNQASVLPVCEIIKN